MGNAGEVIADIVKASNVLVTSVLDLVMKSAVEASVTDEHGERQISILNLVSIIDSAKEIINRERSNG